MATDLLKRDARNRAFRTIIQGLAVSVVIGVVVWIGPFLSITKMEDLPPWPVIIFSLVQTVLTAVASFIMRRFVDKPGDIVLPPSRPGQPNEPIGPQDLGEGVNPK